MKILFLAPQPFFLPRGTPIAVFNAVTTLAAGGHQVDLLTARQGSDIDVRNVTHLRVRRIPFVREMPIGPSWQRVVSDTVMFFTALRMLFQGGYDIVHGVEDGAIMAWVLASVRGVPFVYDMDSHLSAQLSDRSILLWPAARVMSFLERRALRGAAGVLAVCPALVEIARGERPRGPVALLPDMPLFEADAVQPSEEIRAIGGARILYVGNFAPYQGLDLLLGAFGRIAAHHPEAQLILVGGRASEIERYKRSLAGRIGSDRIHFLGERPLDLIGPVLTAADILVSPRLKGVNTPMKIYSYLESGRALLATRLPTHTQVLDEAVAHLVDPTEQDMARGLAFLLEDPVAARELGLRGQTFVRSEFGRELYRRRLERFYGAILEPPPRAPGSRSEIRGSSPPPSAL